MKSNAYERLERRWASQLERALLQYVEAVGPYYTFDDLLELSPSLPWPIVFNFSPESKRDAFYEMVIRRVVQTKLEAELDSELFEGNAVSVTARPPFNAEYVLYLLLRRRERERCRNR